MKRPLYHKQVGVAMNSLLIVLSITSFWMFSSESLVLAGNGGGAGAGLGLLTFVCFSAVICTGFSLLEDSRLSRNGTSHKIQHRRTDPVGIVGIAGMTGTALFASTGILVTAGFTFNEVMYYRFPNFAFAFILLAAVVITSFFPLAVRNMILVITVFTCFTGLTFLVIYGLVAKPTVPFTFVNENSSVMHLLPLLLVFVGIDRVRALMRGVPMYFWMVFFLCVILLCSWMLVSARVVEPHRLITSTIPYMTAAGKIGGESGRLIMGIVVISGGFGAVHGLMRLASSSFRRLSVQQRADTIERGFIVLLTIAIGGMMAAGMAGTVLLEVYIRTSLLLWMVHTGLIILFGSLDAGKIKTVRTIIGIAISSTILLSSLALFFYQEKIIVAAWFAVSMIVGAALLVTILDAVDGFDTQEGLQIKNNTEV